MKEINKKYETTIKSLNNEHKDLNMNEIRQLIDRNRSKTRIITNTQTIGFIHDIDIIHTFQDILSDKLEAII